MKEVIGTAPTRVDLAGGTLDLWPVHHMLNAKATVNVAIDLPAVVKISPSSGAKFELVSKDQATSFTGDFLGAVKNEVLPLFGLMLGAFWNEKLPPLRIESDAKSPAGAGLGGSSCLAVTIGASLWKARQQLEGNGYLPEARLVQTAQDIEARLIAAPTGCQDYWGAVRGGINVITFPYGGVEVATTKEGKVCEDLNRSLIVCYSGKSRASAINNWEIFKRVFDKDAAIVQNFNEIGSLAEQCGAALANGDVPSALEISEQEWRLRCRLWPGIETKETKAIDLAAIKAGAQFSRVCGAGGGGVMAIFADHAVRQKVVEAAGRAGGRVLDAGVVTKGLTVS